MSQTVPAIKFRKMTSAEVTANPPSNLRMIWCPSGTVSLKTWDGSNETTVSATFTIDEADLVSVNNMAKYIKEVSAISAAYIYVSE